MHFRAVGVRETIGMVGAAHAVGALPGLPANNASMTIYAH